MKEGLRKSWWKGNLPRSYEKDQDDFAEYIKYDAMCSVLIHNVSFQANCNMKLKEQFQKLLDEYLAASETEVCEG